METNLLKHITDEEYHGDTSRVSKSGLDLINRSPLHYWQKYLNPECPPEEPSAALVTGKAVHSAVLEPEKFASTYVVMPSFDKRTKKGKADYQEFMEANAEKSLIDADNYETCKRIAEAVRKHEAAAWLLSEGIAESSVFFEEPITKAPCKIRPDWLNTKADIIVDLKTTDDASPDGFGRSALKYRYHVQAPYYLDGLRFGGIGDAKGFIFIAVEKNPPYAVAVYNTPDAALDLGRDNYYRNLTTYAKCIQTGIWAGYGEYISDLRLPSYVFKNL